MASWLSPCAPPEPPSRPQSIPTPVAALPSSKTRVSGRPRPSFAAAEPKRRSFQPETSTAPALPRIVVPSRPAPKVKLRTRTSPLSIAVAPVSIRSLPAPPIARSSPLPVRMTSDPAGRSSRVRTSRSSPAIHVRRPASPSTTSASEAPAAPFPSVTMRSFAAAAQDEIGAAAGLDESRRRRARRRGSRYGRWAGGAHDLDPRERGAVAAVALDAHRGDVARDSPEDHVVAGGAPAAVVAVASTYVPVNVLPRASSR